MLIYKKGDILKAKDYQLSFNDKNYSYQELIELQDYFRTMGKNYGLLKEFKENGVI